MQIHHSQPAGDILIFLTGEDEILSLCKKITKIAHDHNIHDIDVLMLYSALPH